MTIEQIITGLGIIAAILASAGTIANVIRGWRWTDQYTKSMEAQLSEKDEQIKTLEYFSSPHLRDVYDSMKSMLEERIGQLNKEIEEFRQNNESLVSELDLANFRIEQLENEIQGMSISEDVQNSIRAFAAGSRTILQNLGKTVNDLSIVEKNIQKNVDEIDKNITIQLKTAKLELEAQPVTVITRKKTSDNSIHKEDNN